MLRRGYGHSALNTKKNEDFDPACVRACLIHLDDIDAGVEGRIGSSSSHCFHRLVL